MALLGISQMITENMEQLDNNELKQMTNTIFSSTQNLYKLIENLLAWSQLQMENYSISPENIDILEQTTTVCNSLQLSLSSKNIDITNNTTNYKVFADANCVKTILRNLINNAIKFTNRNGAINLSTKPDGKFLQITVKDNGIGMNKEILNNLFSITTKVSELGTEKEVGTGLGLILCKELVEKNGGKIWAESELNKGSKFTFTLPLEKKNMSNKMGNIL